MNSKYFYSEITPPCSFGRMGSIHKQLQNLVMLPLYYLLLKFIPLKIKQFNIEKKNAEAKGGWLGWGRSEEESIQENLQSSCRYASPFADPTAIFNLVSHSRTGCPVPAMCNSYNEHLTMK